MDAVCIKSNENIFWKIASQRWIHEMSSGVHRKIIVQSIYMQFQCKLQGNLQYIIIIQLYHISHNEQHRPSQFEVHYHQLHIMTMSTMMPWCDSLACNSRNNSRKPLHHALISKIAVKLAMQAAQTRKAGRWTKPFSSSKLYSCEALRSANFAETTCEEF